MLATQKLRLFTPAVPGPARSRLLELLRAQLRQGMSVQQIALTVALAVAIGLFPLPGGTALLCLLIAMWLRLNQALMQAVNWLMTLLQLPALYVFLRVGTYFTHAPSAPLSVRTLLAHLHAAPLQFFKEFSLLGTRAALGWLLLSVPLAVLLYVILQPLLARLAPRRRLA